MYTQTKEIIKLRRLENKKRSETINLKIYVIETMILQKLYNLFYKEI